MIHTPGHVHAEHLLLNILSSNAAALIEQQSPLSLIRILTELKCYRRCRKWVIETFTAPVQRKSPFGHSSRPVREGLLFRTGHSGFFT
jgi:hypothetical protein